MSTAKGVFMPETNLSASPGYAGLEEIFSDLFDRLVYFSFQFIKDKDHARDIVQDAFIKYWAKKETVSNDKPAIKSFLYSSVRNASINVVRHLKVVEGFAQQQG